ncbi:hypothetical protein HHL11_06835 [Ramlibacter sp. G-1-2-2]|uniref:Uncharacterized protein n=1 Tax=Ramlibacter agri TaxID=2728837 RepID=A0A848H1G0_9BURK|nr:hypothetical protein [Ramlibacter agri]NML43462.1 hypothetical protein [Ramlibacter agri]
MPSFYIDRRAQADGSHVVHARNSCPPERFPSGEAAEYLGELLDARQAMALGRLMYGHVQGCPCCDYALPVRVEAQEPRPSYVDSLRTARILAAACLSTSSTSPSSSSSWLAASAAGPADSSIPSWTS